MKSIVKSFFYVFLISHILLNFTLINSAVIRRHQRSIITNGTVSGSSDKELDPATIIGLEDGGNLLLETVPVKEDTATKETIITSTLGKEQTENTTLNELKLDENTVRLNSDSSQNTVFEEKINHELKNSKDQESTTLSGVGKDKTENVMSKIEGTTESLTSRSFEKSPTGDVTAKSKNEESTTIFASQNEGEKTEDNTSRLEKNTVGLSSYNHEKSSKFDTDGKAKNGSAKNNDQESTTLSQSGEEKLERTTLELEDNTEGLFTRSFEKSTSRDVTAKSEDEESTTISSLIDDNKEETTLEGLRLDWTENTVGLSSTNHKDSSTNVIEDENKFFSPKTKNEEPKTTFTSVEDKKEQTTLAALTTDENIVGPHEISSKNMLQSEEKTESTKSRHEESTTLEIGDKSTITIIEEKTTISPITNIKHDSTASKEEEYISTILFETTTELQNKSFDDAKNKSNKEETIESNLEKFTGKYEDSTQTIFGEGMKSGAKPLIPDLNNTTPSAFITTTPGANEMTATKTTDPITTNFKLEELDRATESFHGQNELTESSTSDLIDNDISGVFAKNKSKSNMLNEMKLTTESILLVVNGQNEKKQKLSNETFTPLLETTEFPSSTEFFEDHDLKTIVEDFKSTLNDTKHSNSSSTEKRGKFIAHNYSSFNEFHLPNTSDVWALAGLRTVGKTKSSELQNSVETSEEKPVNNSIVTKSLHDWTRVMDTTNNMETKPFLKIMQNTEDPSTEIATSITTTAHATEIDSSERSIDTVTDVTTDIPIRQETTETKSNPDNEIEDATSKSETEPNTIGAITPKEKIERETITHPTESQSTNNNFETTTAKYENPEHTTVYDNPPKDANNVSTTPINSLKTLTNHERTIEENKVDGDSDSFEKETILLSTTKTTSLTPIPETVTVKIETTNSLANGEITREANTGTISLSTSSSSSLSDFTTAIPFLTTSTDAITNTKIAMGVMTDVMTSTPPVIINTDYEVNENSSTISSTSPAAVTTDSLAATTTTTTTTPKPAVTVMAATTETQTQTTEALHTPSISNNETTAQKSSNNYNEYEVVNKPTENYPDNSSTEAFEAVTRVGLHSYWPINATEEISTTEVDKSDDEIDVATISSLENNNAGDIDDIESTITTVIDNVTLAPRTYPVVTDTATVSATDRSKTSTENLDHIDSIHKNSDTAETSIESNVIDPLQVGDTSTAAIPTSTTTTSSTTTTTAESNQENIKMHSTERSDVDSTFSITTTTTSYSTSTTTTITATSTPSYDESATTFESISTKKEDVYSIVPIITNNGFHVPKLVPIDTTTFVPPGELGVGSGIAGGGVLHPMDSPEAQETDVNVIIAISVSTVGIIALILLVAFLYVMRKRQKQMSYGQRCRPVSLDAYSLDNVSVYNSVRRKGATLRASKRSYGNVAFDDPSLRHNVLGTHELARYVEKKSSIWEEFKEVPQIIARADEVPAGCEDKNRYANVIPLPETRVILQQQNGDEKSEYINANYVRGPKDTTNYYIACQAPLETTVNDFWRMIWEQNSRVIIMATDLIENGIDKCAEYLPPSVTLDNHTVYGDYQVTLKNREVKEKYAISTLMLKNAMNDENREITHYWYQWPETGVPTDEAAIIAMLLEARSSLKAYSIEQCDIKVENLTIDNNSSEKKEINGNVASEKSKPSIKDQGPLTIHCSPGTGRTGTILACDIAMRCLEEPKRTVDIPQIVYSVRRGRASAVQTKEQYEFIYKVTHMYATKISNINNDN